MQESIHDMLFRFSILMEDLATFTQQNRVLQWGHSTACGIMSVLLVWRLVSLLAKLELARQAVCIVWVQRLHDHISIASEEFWHRTQVAVVVLHIRVLFTVRTWFSWHCSFSLFARVSPTISSKEFHNRQRKVAPWLFSFFIKYSYDDFLKKLICKSNCFHNFVWRIQ